MNKIFQSDSSKLHLLWSESRNLANSFSDIILKVPENREQLIEKLCGLINFDHWMYEFTVDLEKIEEKETNFTLALFENLCINIKKYLAQYQDDIFENFKVLNPQLRHLPKMKVLIRRLLRKLWRCTH